MVNKKISIQAKCYSYLDKTQVVYFKNSKLGYSIKFEYMTSLINKTILVLFFQDSSNKNIFQEKFNSMKLGVRL
jgi:hypothetical protein